MKARKTNCCIYSILLYFGSPYIVLDYNRERSVWYIAKYTGKFDFHSCLDFVSEYKKPKTYAIEIPLCEIEKLDVIFEPKNHRPILNESGWISDYDLMVPIFKKPIRFSDEYYGDMIAPQSKIVKSYQEIFERKNQ